MFSRRYESREGLTTHRNHDDRGPSGESGHKKCASPLCRRLAPCARRRWRGAHRRFARFCRRTGAPSPCTQESRPLSRRAACQLNRSPVRSGVPETSWPYRGGVPLGRRGRARRRAKSDLVWVKEKKSKHTSITDYTYALSYRNRRP